jgi:hypothetical protein
MKKYALSIQLLQVMEEQYEILFPNLIKIGLFRVILRTEKGLNLDVEAVLVEMVHF